MKKTRRLIFTIILTLIALFAFVFNYINDSKKDVLYKYALDGDSVVLIIDGIESEVRMLGIDTPEKGEAFSDRAKYFTEDKLENAKKIELIKDSNSLDKDVYGRFLYWIKVDGILLQTELVENGLAKVDYLKDNYIFAGELILAQEKAKLSSLGIWSIVE